MTGKAAELVAGREATYLLRSDSGRGRLEGAIPKPGSGRGLDHWERLSWRGSLAHTSAIKGPC